MPESAKIRDRLCDQISYRWIQNLLTTVLSPPYSNKHRHEFAAVTVYTYLAQ